MSDTPRTDNLDSELVQAIIHRTARGDKVSDVLSSCLKAFLEHSSQLERELAVAQRENIALCAFINKEMKMTGNDPRIAELVAKISK